MQVEVFVKDLKKGTLYLERVQDSILVAVDSLQITKEKPIVFTEFGGFCHCSSIYCIRANQFASSVLGIRKQVVCNLRK